MAGHFDLIVIGSGPAGQKGAINAAKMGKRVAIVERQSAPGGVCLHTGTIPSKAMREAALHLTGHRERAAFGDAGGARRAVTMADLMLRVNQIVAREVEVIRAQMLRNGVEVIEGRASFVDAHTVRISRRGAHTDATADCILIATGTTPARPRTVPFAPGRIIDTDELLSLAELPASMIIVGGGVIGVEYACMLQLVGVRVTVVERRERLLETLDDEVVEALQFQMRRRGVRLLLGETVAEMWSGAEGVGARLESGKTLGARALLYAIGRHGATAGLGLERAGLEADERGRLKVNEAMQTSAEHVYAAGDVVGFPALASASMEQGRLATCAAFGAPCAVRPELFPYGIYTIPEISIVGRTEAELTKAGEAYEAGVARFCETARGQIIGDQFGMMKMLFGQNDRRLLGVHIIGEGATELVHIGQAVMAHGGTIDYFADTVLNYPTLAEAYKVAALDGLNRLAAARCAGARAGEVARRAAA